MNPPGTSASDRPGEHRMGHAPESAGSPRSRRFNVGDAMLLTIAMALGLAQAVNVVARISESVAKLPPAGRSLSHGDDLAWWWDGVARKVGPRSWVASGCVELLLCLVVPLAPALIVARLRRPRPPLRSLACQPGFVACALVCLALLVAADLSVLRIGPIPPPMMAACPGMLVMAAWMSLGASRHWHGEASWIDRGGRIVGAVWIALAPLMIWQVS